MTVLSICGAVTVAALVFLVVVVIVRQFLLKPNPPRRGLFVYSDGKRERCIDPITATLALKDHKSFILDRHLRMAYEGDTEALLLTAQAARDVFGVQEFVEPGKPGLTVTECYRLIVAFVNYCESLKKNINPSSTAPTPTESTSGDSSETTLSGTVPSGSVVSEQWPATAKQSTTES